MDADILAAVAAEEAAMADLLAELVAAPTLLGDEAAGQEVMRRAFAGLGLEPFDVPLDPAAHWRAIRAHRRTAGTSRASPTCSRRGSPPRRAAAAR